MTIMESLNNYLDTCPLLAEGKFPGQMCGGKEVQAVLEGISQESVLQRYVDGTSAREALFALSSRDSHPRADLQGLFDNGFAEQLQTWVDQQAAAGQLPSLPQGLSPQEIQIQGAAYQPDQTTEQVRYQVQCKLIYFKGGN